MQDELQHIRLTLWKSVKNCSQHLSKCTQGKLLSRHQLNHRAAVAPAKCCQFALVGSGPKISLQKFNLRHFEKVTLGLWYLKLSRCSADSVKEAQEIDAGRICSPTITKCAHPTLFGLEQCAAVGSVTLTFLLAVRKAENGERTERVPGFLQLPSEYYMHN